MGTAYHYMVQPAGSGYMHLPIAPQIARLLIDKAPKYSEKSTPGEPVSLVLTNDFMPFDDSACRSIKQTLSAKSTLTLRELAEVLHIDGFGVFLLMPRKELIVPEGLENSVLV